MDLDGDERRVDAGETAGKDDGERHAALPCRGGVDGLPGRIQGYDERSATAPITALDRSADDVPVLDRTRHASSCYRFAIHARSASVEGSYRSMLLPP